jgi:hypothetical protein
VLVDDLDVVRLAIPPGKADAKLLVDPNGVLTGRNLSTRLRQRSWEFYEGKAAFAASVSRRGVLAVA